MLYMGVNKLGGVGGLAHPVLRLIEASILWKYAGDRECIQLVLR